MSKHLYILIILLSATMSLCAQDSLRSTMEVRYRATCIKDTVSGKVLADTFRLRFNEKRSFFFEEQTFYRDSLRCYDIAAWSSLMGKMLNSNSSSDRAGNGYYVITDYSSKEYVYQDRVSSCTYRYTDSLASFNWRILQEYKVVASYNCQKAIGEYMGRKYIAWFTNEIPYRCGPWKFQGLSGLIMEVSDSRNQYSFHFLGIYPKKEMMQLFPKKHFNTTKEKFLKELNAYLKDPIAYNMSDNSPVKVDLGSNEVNAWLVERIRSECRHQPMEIIR